MKRLKNSCFRNCIAKRWDDSDALDQQPSGLDVAGIALVLVGVAVQERDEIERVERVVLTDPA